MRLTKKNITHYLLDKGFLDPGLFISGDYILTQTMSRNSIFRVEHQNKTGLFVKQLINQDTSNSYLLQKDATCHYVIHKSELYQDVAKYIPKYYGYDLNHNILVTEYFPNTKSMHEIIYQKKEFSDEHAKKLAAILASFHFDITKEVDNNTSLQFFSGMVPWILNIGTIDPSNNTNGSNNSNSVVVEIQKHPELVKKIEKVAAQWERYSLIHGDIKWMNFIVSHDEKDMKLVDWEIADLGDPLWDVAGVLQSYLISWVLSFNNNVAQYHQKISGTEFLSLETVLPAIKVFWDAYALLQNFTKEEKDHKIIKAVSYMAVRMIQTAFESNMFEPKVSSNSMRIIQFCDHILSNTENIVNEWKLKD